jgi:hypothetical protein
MFLNRQLIKILEDLGVGSQAFIDLQEAATRRLRLMTDTSINTGLLLKQSTISQASQISSLIWHLGEAGFGYHDDIFLSSVVQLAVATELRDLKYRGRIPVKDGMTLYGIMDETGYLQEGQVFVITEQQAVPSVAIASNTYFGNEDAIPGGKQVLVRNNIIITRSPAMHPGDVQSVHAVNVPEDSPLQHLRNVVVFSQHGDRDLGSQLSGGDLDGDLYNIIYDNQLRRVQTYVAAQYPRLSPVELDRPVTANDMSDFFVKFMETDQLGMRCNVHMQLADQRTLGTLDPDCVAIAGMASTAVDFSKTGIAVDMKRLPKYNRVRPDFMAPSPRVQDNDSGEIEVEELDDYDDDAFEGIDEERKPIRYYKSNKVLGMLYRNIDEKQFIADMQTSHHARRQVTKSSDGLMAKLCDYVIQQAEAYGVMYDHHLKFARDVRAQYENNLQDILYHYSPNINMPLSEAEGFAGTILGRQGGAQGKPLRELSKTMRERFDTVAGYYAIRMIHGDDAIHGSEYLDALYDLEEREIEAWPRTIACLIVACQEKGLHDYRLGSFQSFKYIAAASCLKEFERTRRGLGRFGPLPRCEF